MISPSLYMVPQWLEIWLVARTFKCHMLFESLLVKYSTLEKLI